jgi:hypothetical protein
LRAKEISNIRWSMVTDAEGAVTDTIHLVNGASKGKRGGREIPMAKDLRQAFLELQALSRPLLKIGSSSASAISAFCRKLWQSGS